MKKTISLFLGALVLVACGGASTPATDPSSVTSATPTTDPATATPATPAATPATTPAATTPAMPATDAKPTAATTPAADTKPTTPATDAKAEPCGARDVNAKDLKSCKAECQKLDDKAPTGTKCMPPRTQCLTNCDSKFKK